MGQGGRQLPMEPAFAIYVSTRPFCILPQGSNFLYFITRVTTHYMHSSTFCICVSFKRLTIGGAGTGTQQGDGVGFNPFTDATTVLIRSTSTNTNGSWYFRCDFCQTLAPQGKG